MAFQPKNINPLDLKSGTAIGVSIPFNGSGVFNSTFTTNDQLKSNIINFFLTNKGERVLDPDFGGNLRQDLFEQITTNTLSDIKLNITTLLESVFPSVIVRDVAVLGNPDQNAISISIKYSVINTNINDVINLNFNNG